MNQLLHGAWVRKKTLLLATVLGLALPGFAVADTLCDHDWGTMCCYSEVNPFQIQSVYYSEWFYEHAGRGRRYDAAGAMTWEEDIPCCYENRIFRNCFPTCYDACRRTTLKGNGNPVAGWFDIRQSSLDGSCDDC